MITSNQATISQLPTRYIPVPEWHKYHDWPKLGGMRHLIFHAKSNGFAKAIRRVGRRVLIDETAFFEWVQAQGNGDVNDGK